MSVTDENIFESYKDASNDYVKRYKSAHWENEYDNRKVEFTKKSLKDFRNNSLSDGLNRSIGTEEVFIKTHFDDLVKECGREFVYHNLSELNVGNNQNYIKDNGKFIEVSDNFHIKFLYDLEQNVFSNDNDIKIVCEIGGGYGNLSKLIKKNHSNLKIILIDLPEANFFSSYYLKEHFPESNILIYKDTNKKNISMETIENYDFIVIPPWIDLFDIKVDLFINTRSMMEMDYEVVSEYFDLIHKHINIGGYFFNVNKYYKDTVGHPVELDNYPYDDNWSVVLSQPSWKQESKIHELLCKRLNGKDNSIKAELEKIKLLKLKYLQRKRFSFLFESFPGLVVLIKFFLPNKVIEFLKSKIY